MKEQANIFDNISKVIPAVQVDSKLTIASLNAAKYSLDLSKSDYDAQIVVKVK